MCVTIWVVVLVSMLKGSLSFEVKCESQSSFTPLEKKTKQTTAKKWLLSLPLTSRQINELQSGSQDFVAQKISPPTTSPYRCSSSLWNLWISPEFWNGLGKNKHVLKKSLCLCGSPLFWTCVVGLNKDREKRGQSSRLLVSHCDAWCSESVWVCLCVWGHHSLCMAATWRHSWSGPEGGWGKRWWRSRAAGGKRRLPPGLPHDSAAHWCSC